MSDQIDYDELDARLSDPDYPVYSAGQVETSDAAAKAGHEWLLREYGSQEAIDAALGVRRGRPSLDSTTKGPSKTVRARINAEDYAAVERLEKITGRRKSELVREALHQYLSGY